MPGLSSKGGGVVVEPVLLSSCPVNSTFSFFSPQSGCKYQAAGSIIAGPGWSPELLGDLTSLGDVGHGPVCLGSSDSTVRGQPAARVFGRHGGLQESQQSPDGGKVHPAVVHDGVTLVGQVVGLAVPAHRHVLVHVPSLDGGLVQEWTTRVPDSDGGS